MKYEVKKPSWFNWIDLLTIGGGGVVCVAFVIYGLLTGTEGEHATEGLILSGVVGLVFIGIYMRTAWARWALVRSFKWYPRGFMVKVVGNDPGAYMLPSPSELNEVVDDVMWGWGAHHMSTREILAEGPIWVYFSRSLLDHLPPELRRIYCNGFTVSGTRVMYVEYDSTYEPLSKTAFAHELGHIIHGNATKQWDQTEHHKFAAERGLP